MLSALSLSSSLNTSKRREEEEVLRHCEQGAERERKEMREEELRRVEQVKGESVGVRIQK